MGDQPDRFADAPEAADASGTDDDLAPHIRDAVISTQLRAAAPVESIKRHGRRRRRRRRLARVGAGAAAASALTLGALVVIDTADENNDLDVLAVEGSNRTWQWSEYDSLVSRDGTTTGVSVRRNDASPDLLLYFRPGPVCLDAASCAEHPASYTEADHNADVAVGGALNAGTLDPESGYFRDWTVVAVPNATGDLHLGRTGADAAPDGRAHVGSNNTRQIIKGVIKHAKKHGIERIVLAGSGSGAFTVYRAFEAVDESFSDVDVIGLTDSASFPTTPGLPTNCLLTQFTDAWNLNLPRAWSDRYTGPLDLSRYYEFLTEQHPSRRFGLITADDDEFGRSLYGRGLDRCASPNQKVPAAAWVEAMDDASATAIDAGWDVFEAAGREDVLLRDLDSTERTDLDNWLDELMENQP